MEKVFIILFKTLHLLFNRIVIVLCERLKCTPEHTVVDRQRIIQNKHFDCFILSKLKKKKKFVLLPLYLFSN